MRAIEFKTKIQENKILIPRRLQSESISEYEKSVRVMVFVDDYDNYEEKSYLKMTKSQFFKGYEDSDYIYDLQNG